MNEMSAMPSQIANWLGEREELEDMIFLTEFPPVQKAVPLKKVTVAVGITEISIDDSFEEDGEEVLEENEYCRKANIKIRFSIHAPYSLGGEACHNAFADITDCLVFASGLNIIESGCGYITADRDTDALVLPAYAVISANLCPADTTDLVFPSFADKTLLCGSHIRNNAIHLSSAQREYLEEPYVTGVYTGLGDSARTVNLGFKPGVLIVFAGGIPFMVTGGTYDNVYLGIAAGDSGSIGLTLTSNGFRVNNGDSYAVSTSSPRLNEAGVTYTYIAFK